MSKENLFYIKNMEVISEIEDKGALYVHIVELAELIILSASKKTVVTYSVNELNDEENQEIHNIFLPYFEQYAKNVNKLCKIKKVYPIYKRETHKNNDIVVELSGVTLNHY